MISVIVLAPDSWQNTPDAREIVARSLSWLVSAVVAGIVRDVSLAASPALNLGDIAVHVGCDFVEDDDEATRLHACAVKARCAQVLVVKAGFQPTGPLADELEAHGRLSSDAPALLLATPTGFAQNLIPNLADRRRHLGDEAACPRSDVLRGLGACLPAGVAPRDAGQAIRLIVPIRASRRRSCRTCCSC